MQFVLYAFETYVRTDVRITAQFEVLAFIKKRIKLY